MWVLKHLSQSSHSVAIFIALGSPSPGGLLGPLCCCMVHPLALIGSRQAAVPPTPDHWGEGLSTKLALRVSAAPVTEGQEAQGPAPHGAQGNGGPERKRLSQGHSASCWQVL